MSDSQKHLDQKKKKTKIFRFFAILSFTLVTLSAALVSIGLTTVYVILTHPPLFEIDKKESTRIEIPKGSSGKDIARILESNGLIPHHFIFRLALKWDKTPGTIKSGRFDVPTHLSPIELVRFLKQEAKPILLPQDIPPELKLTIPEGYTIRQIAELFDNPDEFIEAAQNKDIIKRLNIEADSLEGFLFPDTYYFSEKPTPALAIPKMVEKFEKVYNELLNESPLPPKISKLELVTIASLVEREAKVDSERPLVAAVIYNRLARNMTLDIDATLQYALNKYGQRMLDSDKKIDSPYNTYRKSGLPPGPICNPGVASLRAALCPADSDVLYFVSNADGKTHTFSKTFAEHTRAVARYRKEIEEQRRALLSEKLDHSGTNN